MGRFCRFGVTRPHAINQAAHDRPVGQDRAARVRDDLPPDSCPAQPGKLDQASRSACGIWHGWQLAQTSERPRIPRLASDNLTAAGSVSMTVMVGAAARPLE